MNSKWREFLTSLGAQIDANEVKSYAAQKFPDGGTTANLLCDLSHYGVISAAGEEAETFLQGQLSNDVRQLAQQSQLSAYSTPKGRMLAIMRLFRHQEAIQLRLPMPLLAETLKRLKMFVMRSKVTLEDQSEGLIRFGLSGPQAADWLITLLGRAATQPDGCLSSNGITQVRIPGPRPRFELYGELPAMFNLWQQLQQLGATPAAADLWALLDIEAGLPNVYPETREAFVAQMTNLHLVNGVSFKKGCYTGQEVIARMQYLGKLKRRMFRARIDTDQAAAGDELFALNEKSGQGTGKLVDARPHPDGGYEALAVISIDKAENEAIHLGTADGPLLQILDLPYATGEAEKA